jgi:hypothetical protein
MPCMEFSTPTLEYYTLHRAPWLPAIYISLCARAFSRARPVRPLSGAHNFTSRMESGGSWNLERFRIRTNSHTDWEPNQVKVALQVELDGCFVPTASTPGVRADTANIVVIGTRFLNQNVCADGEVVL